jgi:AcrR family transcriptional regulator
MSTLNRMDPGKSLERPYHHGDLRRELEQAALVIVTEEQDWAFSLRHVARRAGVSHNAPYNHFADKDALLAAVATIGMERLGDSMMGAMAGIDDPADQLLETGLAYVRTGVANPALYRLMFGSVLAEAHKRSELYEAAGARTRGILEGIITRGAQAGLFAINASDPLDHAVAVMTAWSAVHGLTMLVIDKVADPQVPVEALVGGVAAIVRNGLREPRHGVEPQRGPVRRNSRLAPARQFRK